MTSTLLLLLCLATGTWGNYRQSYIEDKEALLDLIGRFADKEYEDDSDHFGECDLSRTSLDGQPGPLEVNACLDEQRRARCKPFDVLDCENQDCLLGFETDYRGCTISCRCAKEGIFEGDVMIARHQMDDLAALYGNFANPFSRAASKLKQRWDNVMNSDGNFEIPYAFDDAIRASPNRIRAIEAAFDEYAAETCLRFVPWTGQSDYIEFANAKGCYSTVGRVGGRQEVGLGEHCATRGIVMHELMHTMGFWHEQARPDRDEYVRILQNNIVPDKRKNFRKIARNSIDSMGSPYDIQSLMHYGGYYFSRNHKPTIERRDNGRPVTAQRDGFSLEDVKQLNMMYSCHI